MGLKFNWQVDQCLCKILLGWHNSNTLCVVYFVNNLLLGHIDEGYSTTMFFCVIFLLIPSKTLITSHDYIILFLYI